MASNELHSGTHLGGQPVVADDPCTKQIVTYAFEADDELNQVQLTIDTHGLPRNMIMCRHPLYITLFQPVVPWASNHTPSVGLRRDRHKRRQDAEQETKTESEYTF